MVRSPHSAFVIRSSQKATDVSVVRFDTELKEVWALGLQRSQPNLSMVKVVDERLFLLMSNQTRRQWDVLELDEETGHYFLSSFSFSRPFQLKDFVAYKEYMWCSGMINEEPAVFALDGESGGAKALPIGYRAPILDVTDLVVDTENKHLHLTLRSLQNKRSIFIERVLDVNGAIVENWVFESPGGFNMKDFRFAESTDGQPMAVASIYKGNYEQLKGLTVWTLGPQSQLVATDYLWPEVPGLSQALQIAGKNREVDVRKGKWETGWSHMDRPQVGRQGVTWSIDRFDKQYNVRGALQRQQDQEILVNQLDQNQFGRRGFDVNESTLDDRLETFSNTDIATYQYRDVLVGPLDDAGRKYAETWAFSVDWKGNLTGKIIKSYAKSFGAFADGRSPLGTLQQEPVYFSTTGVGLDILHFANGSPRLTSIETPMGPYSLSWLPGSLLNFGFVALEERVYLYLQRYDFQEWIAGTPAPRGH